MSEADYLPLAEVRRMLQEEPENVLLDLGETCAYAGLEARSLLAEIRAGRLEAAEPREDEPGVILVTAAALQKWTRDKRAPHRLRQAVRRNWAEVTGV